MKWTRTIVLTALAAGIATAVYKGMQPQPVEVEVATASAGPMRETVEEEGKTRLRDRFTVSAPVAGFLRRHVWKAGDAIAAGQTVATLEPLRAEVLDARRSTEGEARVRSAEAARQGAEARLASARKQQEAAAVEAGYWKQQLVRDEKLLASGDIAAERSERTRAEARRTEAVSAASAQSVESARAEIERARAEIEAARASISNPGVRRQQGGETIVVASPVSGRVLRVAKDSEGVVGPGEAILEIGNTRALEVSVEVLSQDAVRLAAGTALELVRWGGGGPLQARVRMVEPTGFTKISALGVEEQRVRVLCDIVSPEEEWRRLGEGYRVEAVFLLWEGSGVTQVPASSLFRWNGGWALFAVDGAVARRRPVKVGHRNGLAAEILEGVKPGDSVISHPDDRVSDGQAVTAAAATR